jgi:hypothetical protein
VCVRGGGGEWGGGNGLAVRNSGCVCAREWLCEDAPCCLPGGDGHLWVGYPHHPKKPPPPPPPPPPLTPPKQTPSWTAPMASLWRFLKGGGQLQQLQSAAEEPAILLRLPLPLLRAVRGRALPLPLPLLLLLLVLRLGKPAGSGRCQRVRRGRGRRGGRGRGRGQPPPRLLLVVLSPDGANEYALGYLLSGEVANPPLAAQHI